MKKSTLLFLLFLVSSLLIGYQWWTYSENTGEMLLEQKIEVEHQNGELLVSHTFNGVGGGTRLYIPSTIPFYTCISGEQSCVGTIEGDWIVLGEVEESVSFFYSIEESKLLVSPFIQPQRDSIISLQVSEGVWRNGEWMSNLSPQLTEELEWIDYYSFSGHSDQVFLYWEEGEWDYSKSSKGLSVFHPEDRTIEFPSEILTDYNLTAIMTTKQQGSYGGFHFIKDQSQLATLPYEDVKLFTQQSYTIDENALWILDFLVSLSLKSESKDTKANWAYNQMMNDLSHEELEAFIQSLETYQDSNEQVTPAILDRILTDLRKGESEFFSLVHADQTPLLLFELDGLLEINTNGKEIVYLRNQSERFYNIADILTVANIPYKVFPNEKMIVAYGEERQYRFLQEKNYFVINEEEFGLAEGSVITYKGEMYTNTQFASEAFNIQIDSEN
ncbi:hypothetical protein Q75_05540 [Bacillus coahuilensis p1.1.43]|uniref:Copper amine oxidase-like N-terminal domain-containing protein n=1 Tax=Bacillus coahuilensis p1.1.43 TaxID=1150625 RepID=A0A147K9U2_9BACI|nr:hypothetical protein [Bacillus coahuilensis]KUP07320.1 hypothetical protein Q75_05540 [Bacillus coahuilensis p1.1.43]